MNLTRKMIQLRLKIRSNTLTKRFESSRAFLLLVLRMKHYARSTEVVVKGLTK